MKIFDQAASVSTEECNIQQQLFLLNETIFIFLLFSTGNDFNFLNSYVNRNGGKLLGRKKTTLCWLI